MNIPSKNLLVLAAIAAFSFWQVARVTSPPVETTWQVARVREKEEQTDAKIHNNDTLPFTEASKKDETSFLQLLLDKRMPQCQAKFKNSTEPSTVITYLAVARAASESLHAKLASSNEALHRKHRSTTKILNHHDHDCTLRDLEKRGARRVFVALRHPLERISSGISRRLEGNNLKKKANALFFEKFGKKNHNGKGGAEAFVGALRNQTDPLHWDARSATVGPRKQNYMIPISEFYLANSLGLAEVGFLCIDTLDDDYAAVSQRWFPSTTKADDNDPLKSTHNDEHRHVSKISSGANTVFSRFSKESVDWIEQTYAQDIALFKKHCPEGYRKYSKTE